MLGYRRALLRVLAVSILLSATLTAEVNEPPFVVRLVAVPECPEDSWLEAEVTDQLGEQRAPGGTLDVGVAKDGDSFVALVSFATEAPGETEPQRWQRALTDSSCEVLLRAVSLGIVLWWEGEGLTKTATSATAAPPTASTGEPAAPSVAATSVPEPAETNLEPSTETEGTTNPFRFVFGLGAGVHSGLNPHADLSGEIHLGLRGDGGRWLAGRYVLHLSSVVGDARQGRVSALGNAPSWTSHWWSLGVRACPWGHRMGSFVVGVCGNAQLIRYSAGLSGDLSSNSTWVTTLGPGLQTRWELGVFSLQLVSGLDIPLVPARPEFQQGPVFRQSSGLHALMSADFAF